MTAFQTASMHLEAFQTMAQPGFWGNRIRSWIEDVAGAEQSRNMPEQIGDRHDLKAICHRGSGFTTEQCVWAIFAWGGMRRNNGRTIADRGAEIIKVADAIRQGGMDRFEAFDAFASVLNAHGRIGLTAAFFTKLIFFLGETHDGYIMDQWTGKSVNLISGRPIVKLEPSGHVSRDNTVGNYKEFCAFVEFLSVTLMKVRPEASPEWVEAALFSQGRIKVGEDATGLPSSWRSHVKKHWAYFPINS